MSRPFNQIATPSVADRAMTETLQRWLEAFLAHIARLEGIEPSLVDRPRSWRTVNEIGSVAERFPEDQLPAVYAVSQGIPDDPETDGDGWVRATFRVHVAAVVEANDQPAVDRLCKLYAAAIYSAVMENRSLGGVAAATRWRGGTWDLIPNQQSRSLAGCELYFDITLDQVVNVYEGLDEPPPGVPPADPGEWPVAETVEATIEPQ